MSWTLVSFVGMRPSATAVIAKTWKTRVGDVSEIILLATPQQQTRGVDIRLESYLSNEIGCRLTPVGIGTDAFNDSTSAPSVVSVFRDLMNREGQMAFLADAGLKFLVVAAARTFGDRGPVVHATTEDMVVVHRDDGAETVDVHGLEDIGLESLLGLYDITPKVIGQVSDIKLLHDLAKLEHVADVTRGLFLNQLFFDLCYERHGWLHALFVAVDRAAARSRLRLDAEINRLRPVVILYAPGDPERRRGQEAGVEFMRPGDLVRLRTWLDRRPAEPGHTRRTKSITRISPGAGGSGPPLVVGVGTDPSGTLTALAVHRPTDAWLVSDASTEQVQEVTARLTSLAGQLPCDRLRVVNSDIFGAGVVAALAARGSTDQLIANVSPGSKGQGCALAALPDAELWSLRPHEGIAATLDGAKRIELQAVPVMLQAQACGGDVLAAIDMTTDPRNANLVDLARAIAQPGARMQPLKQCVPNWCAQHNLVVTKDKEGDWFEEIVAALFATAGASEVWRGIRWAWPDRANQARRAADIFRDELDVVARFRHRVYGVSCKLTTANALAIQKEVAEVRYVCRAGLGRFAIPLLVHVTHVGLAGANHADVVLSLNDIVNPADLRSRLDGIVKRVSILMADA